MSERIFDSAISVIAYQKNGIKYGMTIAWQTLVDYDKFVSLIGSQSVTGNNIKKGDIIGISVLGKDQMKIALALGDGHSNELDKFNGISINIEKQAITIDGAACEMVMEVIDVIKLEGIEEDNLVYTKIISKKINHSNYLHMTDFDD